MLDLIAVATQVCVYNGMAGMLKNYYTEGPIDAPACLIDENQLPRQLKIITMPEIARVLQPFLLYHFPQSFCCLLWLNNTRNLPNALVQIRLREAWVQHKHNDIRLLQLHGKRLEEAVDRCL